MNVFFQDILKYSKYRQAFATFLFIRTISKYTLPVRVEGPVLLNIYLSMLIKNIYTKHYGI